MHMQDVNWVDWGILSLVGLSVLMGIWRGFVRESMSLFTWIAALWIGIAYCHPLAEMFNKIPMLALRYLVSFILLVLAVLILGGILSYFTARLISFTGFGVTDRIMGSLLGLARGIIVVALAVMLVLPTPIIKDPLWVKSNFGPRFIPLAELMRDHMSPIVNWAKDKIPQDVLKKDVLGSI